MLLICSQQKLSWKRSDRYSADTRNEAISSAIQYTRCRLDVFIYQRKQPVQSVCLTSRINLFVNTAELLSGTYLCPPTVGEALIEAAIRLSVRLSHVCTSKMVHLRLYGYDTTLMQNSSRKRLRWNCHIIGRDA